MKYLLKDLKELKKKYCIHTDTQEKFDKITKEFSLNWSSSTNWSRYHLETCIRIVDTSFSPKSYFLKEKDVIIEFEDIIFEDSLPTKNFGIQVQNVNGKEIVQWFKTHSYSSGGLGGNAKDNDYYYCIEDKDNYLKCIYKDDVGKYTIYTLKQLQDMETKTKEIIGYKFKPEFKEAAIKILRNSESYIPRNVNVDFEKNSLDLNTLSKLQVLNIWCDEVYKEDEVKIVKLNSDSGEFELEISKAGLFYRSEAKYLNITHIREFIKTMNQIWHIESGNGSSYGFKCNSIDMGCKKKVTLKELENVMKVYNDLNN